MRFEPVFRRSPVVVALVLNMAACAPASDRPSLAGVPDELSAKVPQAVNLNAFPTTFILGRDGRVRAVHAGFPSPASGSFYTEVIDEVTSQIEELLAEPAEAS